MSRGRLLLVDDDALILNAVGRLLRRAQFDVVCCDSIATAREALATGPRFDVLLLDAHLGTECGYAFAEEMRTTRPHVRIVMLTGAKELEPPGFGIRVLEKPLRSADLIAEIERIPAPFAVVDSRQSLRLLSP
jgi:DNA-binding response OmpR family regulator